MAITITIVIIIVIISTIKNIAFITIVAAAVVVFVIVVVIFLNQHRMCIALSDNKDISTHLKCTVPVNAWVKKMLAKCTFKIVPVFWLEYSLVIQGHKTYHVIYCSTILRNPSSLVF